MSWALIWVGSAVAGAVFGWFIGPVPLDIFVQLLLVIAEHKDD